MLCLELANKIKGFERSESLRCRSGTLSGPRLQTFVFIFRMAAGSGLAARSSLLVWWLNTFWFAGPCCKLPVWLHRQVCVALCCSPKALLEHHYYPCKLAQLTCPCSSSLFVNPSFFCHVWTMDQRILEAVPPTPHPPSSPATLVPADPNPCEY